MFISNKYNVWYHNIIRNAREDTSIKQKYFENHHIIPKSLGGSNTKENIVALSPKQHYICHLLLVKMTQGKDKAKMVYAILAMQRSYNHKRYTSKLYDVFRTKYSKCIAVLHTGKRHTDETKNLISKRNTGLKRSDDFRKRISEIAKTRTGSANPFFGKKQTKEFIAYQKQFTSKKVTNGVIIFPSITEAAAFENVSRSTIRNRIYTTHSGWKYVEV